MIPVHPPLSAEPTHRPFDMADYLGDADSQAAALSEALASDHRGIILDTLGAITRARGMTKLARK